jgi:hypothetical protein
MPRSPERFADIKESGTEKQAPGFEIEKEKN